MTPSEKQVRAAIAQQAADLFVKNEEGPLDEAQRAALAAWLKDSPIHVKEFLGVSVIARDLAVAADDPDVSLETLLEQARLDDADGVVILNRAHRVGDRHTRRFNLARVWPLAVSAAAALVLVAVSLVWWVHDGELLGLPKTYETAHGEQAAWRLPDGSMLHLNTDGLATVHYSRTERVVDVNRGEAFLEVVHDSKRRFRGVAGEAHVLAVGTKFDVYRMRNKTTLVTVVEGTVAVLTGDPPPLTGNSASALGALQVSAGQQVGIEAGHMWARPLPVDAHGAVAWLQRQIVVQNRPLGEVAEEFNRYSRVTVEIDEPAVRTLLVSGLFDAYDTESFTKFLGSLDGVAVQTTATRIRVVRSSTSKRESPPTAR